VSASAGAALPGRAHRRLDRRPFCFILRLVLRLVFLVSFENGQSSFPVALSHEELHRPEQVGPTRKQRARCLARDERRDAFLGQAVPGHIRLERVREGAKRDHLVGHGGVFLRVAPSLSH